MWVRARRKAEGTINKGDVGTYVQTNSGSPPCQVKWREYGATYWVQWEDIEVVGWKLEEPSEQATPAVATATSTASSGSSATAEAAASASQFDISPEAITKLVSLGFDEAAVLDALLNTAGDQEAAANLLLG
jgi:hypothetical protein